ncbi:MAG: helix-turn-helix domain-containing protein [Myxococcota bacterium]
MMPPVSTLADEIGKRLRGRRREAGMTQAELAERAGVSSELVSRVERGRCLPSLPTLIAFARVLATTPDRLLGFHAGEPDEVQSLLAVLQNLPNDRRQEIRRIAEALASYERRR